MTIDYHTFDERIAVYSIAETPDGFGGQTTVEVPIGSMWASVEQVVSSGISAAGSEVSRAGTIYTEAKILITTLDNDAVDEKCIIRLGARAFDILDVNHDIEQDQYMQLFCVERGG